MENTKELLIDGLITAIQQEIKESIDSKNEELINKLLAADEIALNLSWLINNIHEYSLPESMADETIGYIHSAINLRKQDIKTNVLKQSKPWYLDYNTNTILRGKISHMIETEEINKYTFEELVSLLKP